MKKLHFLTSVFGIIAIFLLAMISWMTKTFGSVYSENIYFEQILWHIIESPLDGIDQDYIKRGIKHFFLIIGLGLIWFFVIYCQQYVIGIAKYLIKFIRIFFAPIISSIKECIPKRTNIVYSKILFAMSIVFLGGMLFIFDKKFHVYEYMTRSYGITENDDTIKKLYSVPTPGDVHFKNKKNMVLLLAESMENSFTDPALQQVLMPNMKRFQEMAIYNDAMINIYGTGWTIASLTGWFFGLPLKLPHGIDGNSYISKRGFLPGALSIFDILQKNGYELVLIMGTDKRFSGMDILFSGHGSFRILDKNYFIEMGWSLQEYGTQWGFSDAFVLDRAYDEYNKLKNSNNPFVLLIETIDTHVPEGFCPAEKKKYHDIRDAIIEADANIAAFSEKIWKDDVVYIVAGDHFFMSSPEFLSPVKTRTIFNLFHGDIPPVPNRKRHEYFSALDMAPTLLHATGARWKTDQFGLGISLFSDQPTFLESYGPEKMNKILSSWSKFYATLYEEKIHE